MSYDVNPIIDRLCEAFPDCFNRLASKPLKIGLGGELLALVGQHPALADVTRTQVRRAIKFYIGAPAYRKALKRGGPRYDLTGQPAGEVTPEQQALARAPRLKSPVSSEPTAPEPSPVMGYVKMSLKRRVTPGASE
ncbi:MAG: ProQ/FINO family protein [Candidatus Competibacteraceae bacterium]|jgi:sRNA-binding protein